MAQQAAGVREYWLVDCERKQAEFYQWGGEGIYRMVLSGSEGGYCSSVLDGFGLNAGWLWQQPEPGLLDIQRQWGLAPERDPERR
jgi:Uma2 family endonuclease